MLHHTFVIEGRPKVKERPRHGRNGRVYTPRTTVERERAIAAAYDGPRFTTPVCVVIDLQKDDTTVTISEVDQEPTRLMGDVDNYVKAVLDALNGVAWDDDRQVVSLTASKLY